MPAQGEQALGLPGGVFAQHQSARIAGGVTLFIIEPEVGALIFSHFDGSLEGGPVLFALHIFVKRDVADNASKSTVLKQIFAGGILLVM